MISPLCRPDKLAGQCFGLKPHSEFPELKEIAVVQSTEDCRSLCCNLGDLCVSWQYIANEKRCKLGPPVRLGLESSNTDNWCDPFPADYWHGQKLMKRLDGQCTWGESLPFQCFGLGPERLHQNKSGIKSAPECEALCCRDSACGAYQHNSRGCFYAPWKDVLGCDEHLKAKVEGSRKCVPGFCGGEVVEKRFMEEYNRRKKSTRAREGRGD